MRSLTLITSMTVLAGGLALSTFAQQPGGQGRGMGHMSGGMKKMQRSDSCGMGSMMGGMHGLAARAEELELTEEQVQQMRSLAMDWAEKRIDLKAAQQKAHLRLEQALRADEVDMEQVEERLDAVFQARKELMLGRIRHRTEVRGLLTDEQREKLGESNMGSAMMRRRDGKQQEDTKGRGMHRGMRR